LERHRLLWLYLTRETGFCTDHLKVLHLHLRYFPLGQFGLSKIWIIFPPTCFLHEQMSK
jgi:hypothetical protein